MLLSISVPLLQAWRRSLHFIFFIHISHKLLLLLWWDTKEWHFLKKQTRQTIYACNKSLRQLSVRLFWSLLRERGIFLLLETLSIGLHVNKAGGRGEARSFTGEEDFYDLIYLVFLNVPWIEMIKISHLSKHARERKYIISDPKYIRALCFWSQWCISWNSNRAWMGFAYMDRTVLP